VVTVVRRVLAVLCVPVLLLAAPAVAKPYPATIPLPVDWGSEGIATAAHTFYAGSLIDGDIYRGDLRTGVGKVLVDTSGRAAGGLKVDRRHHRLFVAGGGTGHAFVYDSRSGADLADLDLGGTFVNDVALTRDAAYFTETFAPAIYKVPIGKNGKLGPVQTITVTGPAAAELPKNGFGLNGIDATADGRTLIVDHTAFGALYTVDPATGVSREIKLTAGTLVAGTPDGILRVGHDVWVVENFANRLSKVHVSPDWSTGEVTATVTNPAFEVPTTVARHGSRLAVVNGKFDLGLPPPFENGAPAGTPFEVVQFKAP
jgi:hypothetical protein